MSAGSPSGSEGAPLARAGGRTAGRASRPARGPGVDRQSQRRVRQGGGRGPGRAGRLPARRVPDRRRRDRGGHGHREAGADVIEIGLPYSDPLMDGPVIQEAVHRALAGGVRVADVLRTVEAVAADRRARPGHDVLEPGRPLRRGRLRRATWPRPAAPG